MPGKAFQRPYRLCWALLLCCVWLRPAAGQSTKPPLRSASAVAYDLAGNLFIADASAHQVLEATLGGTLVVVAGSGVQGFAGDGGAATSAQLNQPQGLAFGPDGTLYIADTGNQRIRTVGSTGLIATLAGDGVPGFQGDGGSPAQARLHAPTALAVDAAGGLLLCDTGNHRLRRIAAGLITTAAGNGVQGFAGDGGPATRASLDSPAGVAVAPDGRIFLSDTHNHRVRVVGTDGSMRAFAGSATRGYAGDDGPAVLAALSSPRGLTFTAAGDLLIADGDNERIRSVSSAGLIFTLAGTGTEGLSRDGDSTLTAALRSPRSVAFSPFGLPVVADTLNGTVRAIAGQSAFYQPAALAAGRAVNLNARGPTSWTYGQGAVAASVTGPVGLPQGEVALVEGGMALTTSRLAGGTATLDVSSLPAGPHHFVAHYLGDGLNPASTSDLPQASITPLALTATATSASMVYGSPLPQLSGVLSGMLPQDQAQVSVQFGPPAGDLPNVGSYPITASLTGPKAANYSVAMTAVSGHLDIAKANTFASLGTIVQGFTGLPLSLSANVASTTRGVPGGSVEFLDSGVVIATATLNQGSASAVYTSPPSGTRSLTVQYLGDANFLPSASAQTTIAVSPMPDFSLGSSGSQTVSAPPGGTAAYTLVVTAQPGPFTGAVTFSTSGLPAGTTAVFSPPAVVPGTGSATVTMTLQTAPAVALAASAQSSKGGKSRLALSIASLGALFLGRRRSRSRLLWLSSGAVFMIGCGARTVGESTAGVVSQSYTLQVTGTATNLAGAVVTHATGLTLTVKP